MKQYQKLSLSTILNVNRIVTMYYFDFSPGYASKGDVHDFWEIVYVDKGEVEIHADDRSASLRQGDMVFHRPNEYHDIKSKDNHASAVFIITFDCRSAAMKYFEKRILTVPKHLRHCIKDLIDECVLNFQISKYPLEAYPDAPIGGLQMIRIHLEAFLLRLMREEARSGKEIRESEPANESGDHLAGAISAYLEEHLYGKITIGEICEHFHFGKSYLCKLYREAMGKTILQSFLEYKLNEAKRMLQEETLTVSEISERLSFDSPQYFSRMFKQYTGMTPTGFRSRLVKDANLWHTKK